MGNYTVQEFFGIFYVVLGTVRDGICLYANIGNSQVLGYPDALLYFVFCVGESSLVVVCDVSDAVYAGDRELCLIELAKRCGGRIIAERTFTARKKRVADIVKLYSRKSHICCSRAKVIKAYAVPAFCGKRKFHFVLSPFLLSVVVITHWMSYHLLSCLQR